MGMPLRGYRMRHVGGVSWRMLEGGRYVTTLASPDVKFTIMPVRVGRSGPVSYALEVSPLLTDARSIVELGSFPVPGLSGALVRAGTIVRRERYKRENTPVVPTPVDLLLSIETALRKAAAALVELPEEEAGGEDRKAKWRGNVERTLFEVSANLELRKKP